MSQPNWQVRFKDTDGNAVAFFSGVGGETGGLVQITYYKGENKVGNHSITLKGDLSDLSVFDDDAQKRGLDYITEIYYRPYGSPDWLRDYSGFHRTSVWKSDAEGNEILTVHGFDHKHLIARHSIIALPGSAGALKTGVLETVAKAFVNENIGPGAGTRAFPGLSVEGDSASGPMWDGEDVSGNNLLEVIAGIASQGGAFDIVRTDAGGTPAFLFEWYDVRSGIDRTIGSAEPAIFALGRNNMLVPVYSYNRGSEFNVVYVKGDGSQDYAELLPVYDPDGRYTDSPWNSIEVVRKASYDETNDLTQIGLDWMDRGKPLEKMSFQVQQDSDLMYGRDYNVGDLVTGIYRKQVDKLFSGVNVNVTGDSFTFNVTLSDVDR